MSSCALRMLADDLTGALDTAAKFATVAAPIRVAWTDDGVSPLPAANVLDTGCRERDADAAAEALARALPLLDPVPGTIPFLKLDSLLRGHAGAEIAAAARRWPGRPIVVAPALPEQSRVTRGGRQCLLRTGHCEIVGEDIAATLASRGIAVARRSPHDAPSPGVSIVDSETDDDLDRIVDANHPTAPLWCGSSGLAKALARRSGRAGSPSRRTLARPVLGIFGSDHDVLAGQLAAARRYVVAVADVDAAAGDIADRLQRKRLALATFVLPEGVSRATARAQIESRAAGLLERLARPATLVVSGGETLRAVAVALGAGALEVDGEAEAGVPTSRLCGGRWDGVRVISKSGAFGPPDLLARLLDEPAPQIQERTT